MDRVVLPALLLAATLLWTRADAHATMMYPTPRQPESLYWFQVGCLIGCTCAGKGKEMYPTFDKYGGKDALGCDQPMAPTNNAPEKRTFNVNNQSLAGDWTRHFPWRAPGHAKPIDACSIASGFKVGENSFGSAINGFTNGDRGSELEAGTTSYWPAGGTVEARFGILVNHGGGYQYRLCPKNSTLSEDCFQNNPLSFASSEQRIRKEDGTEVKLQAVDVQDGVKPAGSTWRRLAVPACNCDAGSQCSAGAASGKSSSSNAAYEQNAATAQTRCPTGLQFSAPHLTDQSWPEGYGYYMEEINGISRQKSGDNCKGIGADQSMCEGTAGCAYITKGGANYCYTAPKRRAGEDYLSQVYGAAPFAVVDTLQVPMVKGQYVLSWRWDCEQTPQIWITCADIEIRDSSDPVFMSSGAILKRSSGSWVLVALLGSAAVLRRWD